MKKLLLGLLICLCLTSCVNSEDNTSEKYKTKYRYNIDFMEIEGHKYILASTSTSMGGTLPVSIVHAESCKCKDN